MSWGEMTSFPKHKNIAMENFPFSTGKYIYKAIFFPFSLDESGGYHTFAPLQHRMSRKAQVSSWTQKKLGFKKFVLINSVQKEILLSNVEFPSSLSCSAANNFLQNPLKRSISLGWDSRAKRSNHPDDCILGWGNSHPRFCGSKPMSSMRSA